MTFRRGMFNALALSIYVAAAFCPVGISRAGKRARVHHGEPDECVRQDRAE